MNTWISPTEADTLIHAALKAPGTEWVALQDSLGRCLAEVIVADRDLPPYGRAMMDGIAIPSSSKPPFTIQGLHAAGDPPPPPLSAGHAWEIMTGACLPDDCDTVVPYEDLSEDYCEIREGFEAGQCIHRAGSDALAGDELVKKGTLIGPAEVAIAASVGVSQLRVICRPRIALVSSGDEAVAVDATAEPWQIRRSNGPMLEAILSRAGMAPVMHYHIPDDPEATRNVLSEVLAHADLVILCGGISKGKKDYMRPILEESLGEPVFHGVAQKPGKPLAFWAGPPLVFALPGNPVSVLATFSRYVLPTLMTLNGGSFKPQRQSWPEGVKALPKLTWLLALDADGRLRSVSNSGNFAALAGMRGFIEIPPASSSASEPFLRYYPSTFPNL